MTKPFDESSVRREVGRFAVQDRAEGDDVDLGDVDVFDVEVAPPPLPDTPRSEPPDDSDYEFARASDIPNAGEDLKDSARHRWHEWHGLEAAEENGTAAAMVTRDQLGKIDPHDLMSIADEHPLTSLAMYQALRKFPAQPALDTPESRAEYLAEWALVKAEAERLAAATDDPQAAVRALNGFVVARINSRRSDRYRDETANAMIPLHRALHPRHRAVANSPMDHTNKFAAQAAGLDAATVAERAKDMIEGRSLREAFKLDKTPAAARFSAAEAYVGSARRVGGRDLSAVTADPVAATRHVLERHGLRGVQWGNTVTDAERAHHAARLVESFEDLSDAFGLPPETVGLGGELGIAVGARGKGGALAHYEPDTKVMNLTRKRGVGSLAHEWAHALDGRLGRAVGVGHASSSSHTHFYESFDGRRLGCSADLAEQYRKMGRTTGTFPDRPQTRAAMAELRTAMGPFRRRLGGTVRSLVRDGKLAKSSAFDYWTSDHEMFARVSERMVQHRLAEQGRSNTYLSGVQDSVGLWPTDDEVAGMAPAFERLLAAVRSEGIG